MTEMQTVEDQNTPAEELALTAPEETPLAKGQLWKDYLILFSIGGGLLLLDQWTKNWVRTSLAFGETWMPWEWLAPYARVVHWRNTGAAFGMFQDNNLFFSILAVVVVGVIAVYYPQIEREDKLLRLALAVQMGGALGNLADRLQFAHVTDFISVGNFPVFNVADSCITVGAAVLVIGVWVAERRERALVQAEAEAIAALEPEPAEVAVQEAKTSE